MGTATTQLGGRFCNTASLLFFTMHHSSFAVLHAKYLLDPNLSNTEKILISLILNLSNERGYCWASNSYLGKCIGVSKGRASDIISRLVDEGYLGRIVQIDPESKEISLRILTVNNEKEVPVFLTDGFIDDEDTPPILENKDTPLSVFSRIPIPKKTEYINKAKKGNYTFNGNTSYNTLNPNTRFYTLDNVILDEVSLEITFNELEQRNEMEFSDEQKSQLMYLIPDMVKIYTDKNPKYAFDKFTDYAACLKIAHYIAKQEGLSKNKVTGLAESQIVTEAWAKYVDFIMSDKWFREKPLHFLASPHNWQSLIGKLNAKAPEQPKSEYQREYEEMVNKSRGKTFEI